MADAPFGFPETPISTNQGIYLKLWWDPYYDLRFGAIGVLGFKIWGSPRQCRGEESESEGFRVDTSLQELDLSEIAPKLILTGLRSTNE